MLVAMTGATGLIGAALSRALEHAGHEVRALRHGGERQGGHYEVATGWVGPAVLAGVDAVVHLAGASIGSHRWTTARRAELRASRIDTTRLLVDAIATLDRKPRALIVASAIGY